MSSFLKSTSITLAISWIIRLTFSFGVIGMLCCLFSNFVETGVIQFLVRKFNLFLLLLSVSSWSHLFAITLFSLEIGSSCILVSLLYFFKSSNWEPVSSNSVLRRSVYSLLSSMIISILERSSFQTFPNRWKYQYIYPTSTLLLLECWLIFLYLLTEPNLVHEAWKLFFALSRHFINSDIFPKLFSHF